MLILNDFQLEPEDTTLDTSNRGLRDEHIPALVDYLKKNPQITKLDLSHNNLGKKIKTAKLLSECEHLVEINLNSNDFGNKGAIHFLNMPSLKELNLDNNSLSNQGVIALIEAFKKPDSRKIIISIYGNRLIKDTQLIDELERLIPNRSEQESKKGKPSALSTSANFFKPTAKRPLTPIVDEISRLLEKCPPNTRKQVLDRVSKKLNRSPSIHKKSIN